MLSEFKKSRVYTSIIRPVVWGMIREGRKIKWHFTDKHADRILNQIAAVELPLLNQARHEHEKEYQEKEPLVSINIATYSRVKLLIEKTLPSVFAQTYERYEVIIVGDHCADNTEELIRKLNHPKVRFFDLPVRPVYPKNWRKFWLVAGTYAINKSLELSNGLWLAHMDDDDVFTPDHIEVLLKFTLEGNYEFVKGKSRLEKMPGDWRIGSKPGLPSAPPFHSGKFSTSHSATFERSYLKLFKYSPVAYKLGIGLDSHRVVRMSKCGIRNGFLPKIVTELPLKPDEIYRGSNRRLLNKPEVSKFNRESHG